MHTRVRVQIPAGLLLVFTVLLGLPGVSFASEWHQVGLRHADFARELASDGIRFDQKFREWVADFVNGYGDCELKPAANNLSGRERQRVELVQTEFCRPWNQAWRICNPDQSPSWCADPVRVAKQFEKYFDTLTTALKGTRDPLQRYNMMVIVVAATGIHAITEFPADRVDKWVGRSAVEFLRTAAPTEALQVVRLLQATWLGLGPLTARSFKRYAESRVMSAEERGMLNDAVRRRHAD